MLIGVDADAEILVNVEVEVLVVVELVVIPVNNLISRLSKPIKVGGSFSLSFMNKMLIFS